MDQFPLRLFHIENFMGVGFFFEELFWSLAASAAVEVPAYPPLVIADLDLRKEPSSDLYRSSSRLDTEGNTLESAFVKSFMATLAEAEAAPSTLTCSGF